MSYKAKRSFIQRIPAWGLSILTLLVSFILVLGVATLIEGLKITGGSGELFLNIILFLFVASASYLICFIYPRSFWYVPVLSNLITIIAAIAEPIQLTPDWFLVIGGWGFTLLAALTGAWIGRRKKAA